MAREDRNADRFEVNRGSDRNTGRLSDGSAGSTPVPPESTGRTGGANEGVKAGLGEAPRSGRSFEGFRPDAVPGWGEPTPPGMAAGAAAGAAAGGPEAGGVPGRGEEPAASTGSNRADKIRFLSGMLGANREQGKGERDGRRNDGGNAELPRDEGPREQPVDQAGQEGPADQPDREQQADQVGRERETDRAGQERPDQPSTASGAATEESRDAALKNAARLAAGGAAFAAASSRPAAPAQAGEAKAGSEGRPETPAGEGKAGSEGRPETPAGEEKAGGKGRTETEGEGTPAAGTRSSSAAKRTGVAVGAAAAGVAGAAAVAAQAAKQGTAGKPDDAAPPRDRELRAAGATGGGRNAAHTGDQAQAGRPAEGAPSDEANPATGSLSVRPPRSEVIKRANQREEALRAKPVAGRILQAVLAVCFPFLLLIGAIRLVCTPLFLWAEYNRPGFPADSFGFSTDDRMTYGSYAVDYLLNWSGPRYLGDLVGTDGRQLFLDTEVGHMADVKAVIMGAWIGGAVLLVLAVLCAIYLARHYPGGVRRGLFAGSVVTVLLIVVLGVLGALNWQLFFTEFHRIFFAEGTWTFFTNDTLIRLFPGQFWMDAGIVIGLLVFLVSSLVMAFTWPTKSRRVRSSERLEAARARYMGELEDRERF